MEKNTLKRKIKKKLENEKSLKKLTDLAMGMWFFGRSVNGGGPINLTAPLQ